MGVKGICCSKTLWFANILMASDRLVPIEAYSSSACFFNAGSIRACTTLSFAIF